MKKLYEGGVLISLRATQPSATKVAQQGKDAIVNATGAKRELVSASKRIIPAEIMREIKAPVDAARRLIIEKGVPWSSNKTDRRGNRKEDGKWLIPIEELPDMEQVLRKLRQQREEGKRKFRDAYPTIIAEARLKLGTLFNEEDFPPVGEMMERFTWVIDIQPLHSLAHVEQDLRMKLPASWAQEQVEIAVREENKRIANAISTAAREMVDFAEDTVDKLRSHDTTTDDKRAGQTFKEKPLRRNIARVRERMSSLNTMLDDDALNEVVNSLDGLIGRLEGAEVGSIQHDANGQVREDLAKELEEIADKARPALDRMSDLMG